MMEMTEAVAVDWDTLETGEEEPTTLDRLYPYDQIDRESKRRFQAELEARPVATWPGIDIGVYRDLLRWEQDQYTRWAGRRGREETLAKREADRAERGLPTGMVTYIGMPCRVCGEAVAPTGKRGRPPSKCVKCR